MKSEEDVDFKRAEVGETVNVILKFTPAQIKKALVKYFALPNNAVVLFELEELGLNSSEPHPYKVFGGASVTFSKNIKDMLN